MSMSPESQLPPLTAEPAADAGGPAVVDLCLLQMLGAELVEHSRAVDLSSEDRSLLADLAQQLKACAGEDPEPSAGWARELSVQLRACAEPHPPRRQKQLRIGALRIALAA